SSLRRRSVPRGVLPKLGGQLGTSPGVLGIIRQVLQLMRIARLIQQHRPAGGEFGVAIFLVPDGRAPDRPAVLAPDAEGGMVPLGAGIFEQWDERNPFEIVALG